MSWSIGDDIIDSRDIIERLEELRDEKSDLEFAITEAQEAYDNEDDEEETSPERYAELEADIETAKSALREWEDDNASELTDLEEFEKNFSGYGDWEHGETLIEDDHFVDFAQQMAQDCCEMPANLTWPLNCIDWEQAADELKHDYMCAEIDGNTYWMRA
jgi:DNA-binding transcriptional MerR regulator